MSDRGDHRLWQGAAVSVMSIVFGFQVFRAAGFMLEGFGAPAFSFLGFQGFGLGIN